MLASSYIPPYDQTDRDRLIGVRIRSVFLVGFDLVRSTSAQEHRNSHIIVLLADDLGWNGVEHYDGDLHEPPDINRLAEENMTFTNASRASALKTRLHQWIEPDHVQMSSENTNDNPNEDPCGK